MKALAIAAWFVLFGILAGAMAKHRAERTPMVSDFQRGRQDRVQHWACWGEERCRLCECSEEAPDGCVRRVCSETCVECEVKR